VRTGQAGGEEGEILEGDGLVAVVIADAELVGPDVDPPRKAPGRAVEIGWRKPRWTRTGETRFDPVTRSGYTELVIGCVTPVRGAEGWS